MNFVAQNSAGKGSLISVTIDNSSLQFKLDNSLQHNGEFEETIHHRYEIYMVASGSAEIEIDGSLYDITQSDMFIIAPGTRYRVKCSKDSAILILGVTISQKGFESEFDFYENLTLVLNKICGTRIRRQTEQICIARDILKLNSNKATFAQSYKLQALLILFILRLYDNLSVIFNANIIHDQFDKGDVSMYKASDIRAIFIDTYFRENLTENITLSDLASRLSLSTKQINRIIKSTYGKTFYAYVTELRIEKAKQLLKADDLAIEDVAYKVGYSTHVGFYTAFRNSTGITPGKYRAESQNGR